nr:hypothetical protein Iba_chr05fCG6880 [Ipomoea batatas]
MTDRSKPSRRSVTGEFTDHHLRHCSVLCVERQRGRASSSNSVAAVAQHGREDGEDRQLPSESVHDVAAGEQRKKSPTLVTKERGEGRMATPEMLLLPSIFSWSPALLLRCRCPPSMMQRAQSSPPPSRSNSPSPLFSRKAPRRSTTHHQIQRSLVLIRPLELHDVRLPGQMLQDHNLPPRVLDILRRHKLPPRNFLARVFQPVAFSVAIVKQFRGNGISGIGRDPYN